MQEASPEAIQILLKEVSFSWHETLGVPPNADAGTIRRARAFVASPVKMGRLCYGEIPRDRRLVRLPSPPRCPETRHKPPPSARRRVPAKLCRRLLRCLGVMLGHGAIGLRLFERRPYRKRCRGSTLRDVMKIGPPVVLHKGRQRDGSGVGI
jgi:hypothetical protein